LLSEPETETTASNPDHYIPSLNFCAVPCRAVQCLVQPVHYEVALWTSTSALIYLDGWYAMSKTKYIFIWTLSRPASSDIGGNGVALRTLCRAALSRISYPDDFTTSIFSNRPSFSMVILMPVRPSIPDL